MATKQICPKCYHKAKLNNYGLCDECNKLIPNEKSSIFVDYEQEQKSLRILRDLDNE